MIAFIILAGILIANQFNIFSSAFRDNLYVDTGDTKYQYMGEVPIYGETCQPYDIKEMGLDFNIEKVVNTEKSSFKFITTNFRYLDIDGQFEVKYRYDVQVYKDGLLIDRIIGPPSDALGTCYHSGFREQKFYRAYSDSGQVYIPDGDEVMPIVYSENPGNLGCPSGTYEEKYTKEPYNMNPLKNIELPDGETGINAEFGFILDQERVCDQRKAWGVNKFEIVRGEEEIPPEDPPKPTPSGFYALLQKINEWLTNFFKSLFGLTITGEKEVEPNTQHTYFIDMATEEPDNDWSDGSYQIQYGSWALIDKNENIKQEGQWEELDNGIYIKSVTITTPSEIGDYALVGLIDQFDMVYDYQTKQWSSIETIVNKEAIDLKSEYTVEEPSKPVPSSFTQLIQRIIEWIKDLFGRIFG